jgi:hypothetical protein
MEKLSCCLMMMKRRPDVVEKALDITEKVR